MQQSTNFTVGICGAGFAGLGLAIALQAHDIYCSIYEASDAPAVTTTSSLQIAANGLSALEPYGLLTALAKHSCFYKSGKVRNNAGEYISTLLLGDKEHFGHDCMRIIRGELVGELVKAVNERGIQVHYGKKFTQIVSESKAEGVIIEFDDGATAHASLLIGADGIYSRLRRALFPEAKPQYIGTSAVTGSACSKDVTGVNIDDAGMYIGKHGVVLTGPHAADDTNWMVGMQKPHPDLGKDGWKRLAADKQKLREFMEEEKGQWPPHVQDLIGKARDDSLTLWAMYTVPKLDSWLSPQQRIILIGDAAHAVSASAGQGANMAFEDGHTLGLVISAARESRGLDEALNFWHKLRQERLQHVVDLTKQLHKMRKLGDSIGNSENVEAFRSAGADEERIRQLRWLFSGVARQEEAIKAWATRGN